MMTNYGEQFMRCPECGGAAEAECVDVGVGLYIKDEYECSCGYNSAADGRANVGSYDDWFVGNPIVASQQCGRPIEANRKVRDGYADQARFADVEQASYFREFVRRIDAALS